MTEVVGVRFKLKISALGLIALPLAFCFGVFGTYALAFAWMISGFSHSV